MATLRFSFGTMGSGKSTLALQIHHNLAIARPVRPAAHASSTATAARSPAGSASPRRRSRCAPISTSTRWPSHPLAVHFLVCDEAQFYTPEQCDQLARVVDELGVDVYAFGLITDFRGAAVRRHQAAARDRRRARRRCRSRRGAGAGARATHNARARQRRRHVYEGETVVVGDTEDEPEQPLFGDVVRYELLCRRHYRSGRLSPSE